MKPNLPDRRYAVTPEYTGHDHQVMPIGSPVGIAGRLDPIWGNVMAQYKNTEISTHGQFRVRFRMLLVDGMAESWHEVLGPDHLPLARCPNLQTAVRIATALEKVEDTRHEPA